MQDESNLSLSVSVVCYHSSIDELRKLISSLIASVRHLKASFAVSPIAVFLIDNSEQENLSLALFSAHEDALNDLDVELRLNHGHGNIGYGAAHNLIIANLNSDYHLLLNPDVELHEECLSAGISHMDANENLVLTSPFAQYANGTKQYLCKRYPAALTFLARGFLPAPLRKLFSSRLAKFEMHDLSETEPTSRIPIVSGCFMLCRTDALKQVGGFDENYFLYFEDFDLSLRISKLGEIAYLPQMKILHAGGHAARKGFAHLAMFAKSAIRFFNTHGWRFFKQTG